MLSSLAESEKDALLDVKKEISGKYGLRWMKLFGSKSRGDFDLESDLDIVIVVDRLDWQIEKDIYEICFYASLKHDLLISPIVFSEDEVNSGAIQRTPFYKVVEREGFAI